jgi:hypothetical protein
VLLSLGWNVCVVPAEHMRHYNGDTACPAANCVSTLTLVASTSASKGAIFTGSSATNLHTMHADAQHQHVPLQ